MILSGRDIELYLGTGKLVIKPVEEDQFQQNGIDLILDSIRQENGQFYLGCTKETIQMPDDLMAFVELRSSWARRGFLVPPTIVDAGFKGNLTLEILVVGTHAVEEALHQRFAHLIFAKTSGPCIPYTGKYTNQTGITGAIL